MVRQQWRSQRAGSRWQWEWLARRGGQRDWKQGTTAREAIRQATLLPPGKQPGWLCRGGRRGRAPSQPSHQRICQQARTPVELRASTAVPASFARRPGGGGERRRGAARAGCRGARERRRSPGCCSSPRSGSASTLATGSHSPVVAASVLARRTTCSVRLRRCGRRAGGCGIRCRGRVGGDIDSVAISPTGIAVAIVFCPYFGRRECPSLCVLLRWATRSLPGCPSACLAALAWWHSVVSRWCCRAVRRIGRCLHSQATGLRVSPIAGRPDRKSHPGESRSSRRALDFAGALPGAWHRASTSGDAGRRAPPTMRPAPGALGPRSRAASISVSAPANGRSTLSGMAATCGGIRTPSHKAAMITPSEGSDASTKTSGAATRKPPARHRGDEDPRRRRQRPVAQSRHSTGASPRANLMPRMPVVAVLRRTEHPRGLNGIPIR